MLQDTASSSTTAATEEEEERYVKVASRFFRVKPRGGGVSSSSSSCSSCMAAARRRLHYLDSCFLCKKAIDSDRDIFMYKGDAAFCSEDCRLDQMDMDEALQAAARRHRLLPSSRSQAAGSDEGEPASSRPPTMMRGRRPTIANLAARNPPVAAT